MIFSRLTLFWSRIEKTASRNEMTRILADLLKEASPGEVRLICYLSQGRLGPLFEPLEFNLAEKMMLRVLAQAYEAEEETVRQDYKKTGDLGDVAYELSKKVKIRAPKAKISVAEVYGKLKEVAEDEGEGSVERKIGKTAGLLRELDPLSVKYVVRIPLGRLRLGFSDLTVLDALSWMVGKDKSKRSEVEAAFSVRADVGLIAERIRRKRMRGLRGIGIELGVPVMPALCQRLPDTGKIIEKMIGVEGDQVAVEPKYDGTRLQVHFSRKKPDKTEKDQLGFDFDPGGFVRVFTRNLENVSRMFPDVVRAVFEETTAREAILDGEAIGWDPKTGDFLPFQETIKRKRKHDVGETAKEIPLKFIVFDLLFLDGRDWLGKPFKKRRRVLEGLLRKGSKVLMTSPLVLTARASEIKEYHRQQIEKGLEGVVVKKWSSPYDPGKRGYTWVKLKQESGKKGAGLADTLDCVVMGYYAGKGKRAGFGIGMFLVGVRDGEKFSTVSKVGTGLTDVQWREMKQRCEKVKTAKKPKEYKVPKGLVPDTWCAPEIVVEIEADNVTRSPLHAAEYALRFPRLIQFRDDKTASQTSTLRELKNLYKLQG